MNLDAKRKPVKKAERVAGPYPYYGASGIVDHVDGYLFDGEYLLVAEDGENLRTRNTPIAFRATGRFWVNNHAHILKDTDQAGARFLEYALLHCDITSYLTGAVMPKLTQGNLNKIELPCPPKDVQEQIVGVLGSLDDRIDNLRQSNATLEAIAQVLFKSWFVDFDPVRAKVEGREPEGMDTATAVLFPGEFENSELGSIPKGWRVVAFESQFDFTMGQSPPGGTYNTDGLGIPFYQGCTDFGQFFPRERVYCTAPTRMAQVGDVLMSVRAPVGAVNVAGADCAIGRGLCAIRHKSGSSGLTVEFIRACVQRIENAAGEGALFKSLGKSQLANLPIVAMEGDLLRAATGFLDPILQRRLALARQTLSLEQLRNMLLPRLISGKLRLPEAEALVDELA